MNKKIFSCLIIGILLVLSLSMTVSAGVARSTSRAQKTYDRDYDWDDVYISKIGADSTRDQASRALIWRFDEEDGLVSNKKVTNVEFCAYVNGVDFTDIDDHARVHINRIDCSVTDCYPDTEAEEEDLFNALNDYEYASFVVYDYNVNAWYCTNLGSDAEDWIDNYGDANYEPFAVGLEGREYISDSHYQDSYVDFDDESDTGTEPYVVVTQDYPDPHITSKSISTISSSSDDVTCEFTADVDYSNSLDYMNIDIYVNGVYKNSAATWTPTTPDTFSKTFDSGRYGEGDDVKCKFTAETSEGKSIYEYSATQTVPDTTAPTTTASATSPPGGDSYTFGDWTADNVEVTLSCSDSGSGCDTTYYCTDTANSCAPSTTYSSPVTVSTAGTSYIRFYSTDTSSNTESTNSETIKISTNEITLNNPLDGATNEGRDTTLNVTVSNSEGDPMNVSFFRLIDNLNDTSTAKNLTFSGNENKTVYLDILKDSIVTYATLGLTGFESGGNYPSSPYVEVGTPDGTREWEYIAGGEAFTAYYEQEETTGDVVDATGNGYNGTTVGGVSRGATGKVGNAFNFDGVDDYFYNNGINGSTWDEFSMGGWVKFDSLMIAPNNAQTLISLSGSEVNSGWIIEQGNGDGAIRFYIPGINHSVYTYEHLVKDTWYHVIGTAKKNGEKKLYINGALVNSTNIKSWDNSTLDVFMVGAQQRYGPRRELNGTIDETFIINEELSPSEVSSLWNSSNGRTYSSSTEVFSSEFSVTEETSNFSSPINSYLSTCTADSKGYCQVPLLFNSNGSGIIQIDNINITSKINTTEGVSSNSEATFSFGELFSLTTYQWWVEVLYSEIEEKSAIWTFTTEDFYIPSTSLNSPTDGATGVSTSPTLNVTYSHPEGDAGNVSFYNGSTWDLSYASYDNVNISTQAGDESDLFFKSDGTKMYELNYNTDYIYQYSCSDAWNLSSCSYDSVGLSIQTSSGMFFKPDGNKLYITGIETDDTLYQYSCSNSWDVSSCSYNGINISTQESYPKNIFFKDDGTKMIEASGNSLYEYTCSDAWNLSSCSYDGLSISGKGEVGGIFFKTDGTKFFQADILNVNNEIHQYSCSDAWNLSSCSYDGLSISGQDNVPVGVYVKSEGDKFYVIGAGSSKIYQYSIGERLSTQTSISNNTEVTYEWAGLDELTTYDWYTTADDGNSEITTSESWNFTTTDNTPPQFTTIPGDDTITYGTDWTGVDFDATDSSGIEEWFINDTRFTINQTGYLDDNPTLSAGTYAVNVSVNDTYGNTNSTIYTLTVNKATPSASLSNNRSWAFTYDGTAAETTFTELNSGDEDVVYILWKDDTEIVGDTDSEATVGTYVYKVNSTEGQNYTATDNLDIETLTISKGPTLINISFSGNGTTVTNKNYTIEGGDELTVTSTLINVTQTSQITDTLFKLFENGSEIGSRIDNIITYSTSSLLAGTYYYNSSWDGNENYTGNTGYGTVTVEDTTAPNTTLISPENNTYDNSYQQDFVCNSSDKASNLKNVSLSVWKGGVLSNSTTVDISGGNNQTTFSDFTIGSSDGDYEWNCYTCDNSDLCTWGDNNRTLKIDTVSPSINHTYENNTNRSTKDFNNWLNFDGSNDYIDTPLKMSGGTGVTLSAWVKSSDLGTIRTILDNGGTTTSSTGYLLRFQGNGQLVFSGHKGVPGEINFLASSTLSYDNDSWHLVQGTWDGTINNESVKLFVDGINVANATADVSSDDVSLSSKTSIGRYASSTSNLLMNGSIDEVQIFDKALTQAEITNIYNLNRSEYDGSKIGLIGHWAFEEGTGDTLNDNSRYENDGTIYGNPEWAFSVDGEGLSLNLTANASDNEDIKNTTLNIWNSSGIKIFTETTSYVGTALEVQLNKLKGFTDGLFKWSWSIFDFYGNKDTTENYTVRVDSTAPNMTITYPSEGAVLGESAFNITHNVSDNYAGLDSCYWSNDSGITKYNIECNQNLSVNLTQEGEHTYTFYANDTFGNVGLDTVTFYMSLEGPAINLEYPLDNSFLNYSENIPFNFTATDFEGLDTCILRGNFDEYVFPDGIVNKSVDFDGEGDYIEVGERNTFDDLYGSGVTISLWFNTNTTFTEENGYILSLEGVWDIQIEKNTGLLRGGFTGSTSTAEQSPTALNDGNWHNALIKYNWSEGTQYLYVDGTNVSSTNIAMYDIGSLSRLNTIGRISFGGRYFNGSIDEVTIFNRSLTETEITNLHTRGLNELHNNITTGNVLDMRFENNFLDSSGEGNDGTQSEELIYPFDDKYTWTSPVSGEEETTNLTLSERDTSYEWNVWCNDTTGKSGLAPNNRVFTIDTTYPNINYGDNIADNNSNFSRDWIFVNITSNESNLESITFFLYNETSLVNYREYSGLIESHNFTDLEDDVYFYNVSITDEAGNTNSTDTRKITLDTTEPLIEIISPENKTYDSKTQLVNISSSDENLQDTWYNWNGTNYTYSSSLNIEFDEGSNTLYAWANDTAGNINSTEVTFFTDSIYPQIQFTNPTEDNNTNFSRDWIYANVSVVETNFENITFSLYNQTNQVNTTTFTEEIFEINWPGLDNDVYYYNVTIYDIAGNINSTDTRKITLDTENPNATQISPENNTYNSSESMNFSTNLTDNSGLKNATITVHNGTEVENETTITFGDSVVDYTWNIFIDLSEGIKKWWVEAFDWAGNYYSTENKTFTLDTTAPSVSQDGYSPSTVYNDDSISIYGEVSDIYLEDVWIEINATGEYQNVTVTTHTGDRYVYGLDSSLVDNHENISWRWYANDTAGNLNVSEFNNVIVSNRYPQVELTSPSNDTYSNKEYQVVNFTSSDEDGDTLNFTFHHSTDGVTFTQQNIPSVEFFNFTDFDRNSEHYFYVNVSDGDLSNTSETIKFTADNTPPTFSIISPERSPTVIDALSDVPLNYTITETNPDFCEFNVTLNDTVYTPHTILSNCENTTFGIAFDNAYPFLNFKVYDKAGNTATTSDYYLRVATGSDDTSSSGGGGGTPLGDDDDETELTDLGYCGDGVCQDGRDNRTDRGESFYNCPEDCQEEIRFPNLDQLFFNCFDEETQNECVWITSPGLFIMFLFIVLVFLGIIFFTYEPEKEGIKKFKIKKQFKFWK